MDLFSTNNNTTCQRIASYLNQQHQRIAIFEATSGGLVSALLLAQPGASSWFISGAIIYTGRGAKRLLPKRVLELSSLMDRENNYKNREAYVESKLKYVQVLAVENKNEFKADWCIVESGTSGPDYYVPGVHVGFTAVGVCSPSGKVTVKLFESTSNKTRIENMIAFTQFTLQVLLDAIEIENSITVNKL
jgi:nicotinamide-nucleotide amidase